MKEGSPTKYKPEFAEEALKLCLLGATDTQLADFFNVCRKTIHNWKLENPEFLHTIKKGKIEADSAVSKSLFNRAKGYSRQEDKIFLHEGEPVIVKTTKHYPPDTTACIFWLKNRMPEDWRDVKHIEAKVQKVPLIETKEELEEKLREMDEGIENE